MRASASQLMTISLFKKRSRLQRMNGKTLRITKRRSKWPMQDAGPFSILMLVFRQAEHNVNLLTNSIHLHRLKLA
jgi:hypothetical protein